MSRSKKDILDTEAMLHRLGECLAQHAVGEPSMQCRADAQALRRISITLHRWHELECNEDVQRENGKVYIVRYLYNETKPYKFTTPDREAGARKRLAAIMARYPTLQACVQTDLRGCALYILKPGDVPQGATVDSCYSRGLAVFQ